VERFYNPEQKGSIYREAHGREGIYLWPKALRGTGDQLISLTIAMRNTIPENAMMNRLP